MADISKLQLEVDSSQVRKATEDSKRFAEQTERTASAVEQGMRAAEREVLAARQAREAKLEQARSEEAFRMSMEQTSSVTAEVRLHFEELRLEYERGNVTQEDYAATLEGMQQRLDGLDKKTIESVRAARMLNTEMSILGGEAQSTSANMQGTRTVMNTLASTVGSLASGSGNLSSQLGTLTRNLGFMTQHASGAGLAIGQITGFIMSPAGLIFAAGAAIPLVVRLTQALMDKGEEAYTTEEKVKSLSGVIDNYIGTLTRLNSIEIYNPLGVITSQSNLENLQNLHEHLQEFFDIQEEALKATSDTRAFGAPTGGFIPAESVSDAQALREEYWAMQEALGALADVDREYLEEKMRGIELEIAYQEAMINTNSILRLQHDITQEVSGTLRDHRLGLEGSEEALTALLDKYQGLAQALRDQDREFAGQGDTLGVIQSLTEEQRKELEVYTEVIDRLNRALGNTETVNNIVAGSVGDFRSQISSLNEAIARSTSAGEIERYMAQIAGLEYEIQKLMGTLERPTTEVDSPVDEILDDITTLNEIIDSIEEPIFDRYIPPESLRAKMIELQRLNIELDYAFSNDQRERLRKQIEDVTKEINQMRGATETVNSAARDLGMTFSSSFEEAIMSGNSLRSVLAGILEDISRIILRQKITNPLAGAITSAVSGGSLFGGANVESVDDALITSSGDIVRFHPDDDILAMKDLGALKAGESQVNVTVINNAGADVDVQQRENADGSIDIALVVERTMKDAFNSGRMDRTLSQFGVSRSGRRRG